MSTKLGRWGNSLGLRLPQYVVERAGLAAGDYLYIRLLDSGEIIIRTVKADKVCPEYGVAPTRQQPQKPDPKLVW